MRVLLCLAALAACGDNDGAVLTFVAPEGFTATRIELVLASSNDAKISRSDQRVRPGGLGNEPVIYYRQRATAGAIELGGTVNGFEVRIAPEEDVAPDETFVPFALVFEGDALVAVGSVTDDEGAPQPVMIKPSALVSYTLTVLPLTTSDASSPIGIGQGRVVACGADNADAWRSGVAWKPELGPQVRLLLPDLAADPVATDASERAADLDCDLHDARQDDCDDLRTAFHADQPELCDGLDTDCDGQRVEVMEGCTQAQPVCTTAGFGTVSYCYDMPDGGAPPVMGACQADAACLCELNGTGNCGGCSFDFTFGGGGATKTPCAPALGKLNLGLQTITCTASEPCTVRVSRVDGPFTVKLSATDAPPFTSVAMLTEPKVYLDATYLGGALTIAPYDSLGAVYVTVTQGGRIEAFPVNFFLGEDMANQCQPSNLPGTAVMHCRP